MTGMASIQVLESSNGTVTDVTNITVSGVTVPSGIVTDVTNITVSGVTVPSGTVTDVTNSPIPGVTVTNGTVTDVMTALLNSTNTSQVTLQQLNDEEFYRRLAPIIYLAVLMVIGTPGNLLVLGVYFRNFKKSTHRTFILALAVVDLLVCVVSLPFEIIEMRHQYTFYYAPVCKFFRANNNFLSLGSIFIICCMSVDRYRRVCHPLRNQMTPRISQSFCVGAMVVALLFAWPNFVISGIRHPLLKNNITGSDCSLSDQYAGTIFPLIYGGILFIIFLSVIIYLIVVYTLIARTIYRHSKFRGRFASTISTSNNTQMSSSSEVQHQAGRTDVLGTGLGQGAIVMSSIRNDDVVAKPEVTNFTKRIKSVSKGNVQKSKTDRKHWTRGNISGSNTGQVRTAKITRITFMISLVFILSFLPHLTLSLMTAVKGGFVAKPGPIVSALLPIVTRSFVINHVANPLIYGFLDPKFRQSCKNGFNAITRC